MSYFPEVEVKHILGRRGQTFERIEITWSQLGRLIDCGAADRRMYQNDAPTIGDLYDALADVPNLIYEAYVCWPPRVDARVSVDGFRATGLNDEMARRFRASYVNADESEVHREDDGTYSIRFWWD
jgi:hypothetical protein